MGRKLVSFLYLYILKIIKETVINVYHIFYALELLLISGDTVIPACWLYHTTYACFKFSIATTVIDEPIKHITGEVVSL